MDNGLALPWQPSNGVRHVPRLPTISVFLVDYPVPVVMALPPTTCLITSGDGPEAYGRQVLEAVTQLSAAV
jgi:hypothetical protein